MKTKLSALFFLTCLISGCYREIEVDFPERESLPVANSIFQTDSLISVVLNKTQPILDNGPTAITDALVTLYEDGVEKEMLEYDDGSFTSSEVAEANKTYRIEVEISNFETVVAEEELVDFPNVILASFKDSVYIGDEGDLFSQLTLEIENTPDRDYFELDFRLSVRDPKEPENDEESFFSVTSSEPYFDSLLNDVVIQNEGLLSYIPTDLVFSDELMNAGKHTLRINYRPFSSSLYSDNPDEEFVLLLTLRKVSKNYYEYKKTLTQHLDAQFGDIWDGVGQPLPVFSNIQNGYGIFAGYSQVTDTIQKQ